MLDVYAKKQMMGLNSRKSNNRWQSWLKLAFAPVLVFSFALLLGMVLFSLNNSQVSSGFVEGRSEQMLQSNRRALGCTGANCNTSSQSPSTSLDVQTNKKKLFLFVGILSGRGFRHRRTAARTAWTKAAQQPGLVVCKFILSEDERTPQVDQELAEYNDIIFTSEKTNYKSILFKTFFALQYPDDMYDVSFVLKTDDDAFVNIPALISQLKSLCETPDCVNERIYMGRMARHSEVLLQPGHKWNNDAFYQHTGLTMYPNYMMGGGYVVSGPVCRALTEMHRRVGLKFTPIEDASIGFFLAPFDVRHIDHPKFYTWAAPCCFRPPQRRENGRYLIKAGLFELDEKFEENLCSEDPWVILHKIDSPSKMRVVADKYANCTTARGGKEYGGLVESIVGYYPERVRKDPENEAFFTAAADRSIAIDVDGEKEGPLVKTMEPVKVDVLHL